METIKKHWIVASVGSLIVVLAAGSAWLFFPRRAVAPEPVVSDPLSTETNSTTTPDSEITSTPAVISTGPSHPVSKLPSIAKGDVIASWDFKGAYADNAELIAKANTEINRFSGLLATTTSSTVSLLVSIANQYDYLGNGKQEYDYLSRAIEEGGETTGLPWHNLGVLMEKLGALQTARGAYEKSTLVQPQLKQWHFSYLEFLTTRMKTDVTDIKKAFTAALKNLGQDTDILALQSEWEMP